MGTGRKFHKKPATRPRKSGTLRKQRDELHEKRLVALGMKEEIVSKMTSKAVKDLLKYPKKTEAAISAGKL